MRVLIAVMAIVLSTPSVTAAAETESKYRTRFAVERRMLMDVAVMAGATLGFESFNGASFGPWLRLGYCISNRHCLLARTDVLFTAAQANAYTAPKVFAPVLLAWESRRFPVTFSMGLGTILTDSKRPGFDFMLAIGREFWVTRRFRPHLGFDVHAGSLPQSGFVLFMGLSAGANFYVP